jgi:hypothetical protein
MLILIPHLFPPRRLLEAAVQGLRLPALETLVARGTLQLCPADGIEAALCEALGIPRQLDWPLAPITLEADGGTAEDAYWLRADPVHLQLMRDRIVLTDNSTLDLSRQEAETLAASIGQHFGESLRPVPLHPKRWYVHYPSSPRLVTTPVSVATGRAIDPLLPQGVDAPRYRAQLNELQMLLHEHPVNQARVSRGELPVNSLWLWGGGCKPGKPLTPLPVYARDDEARALGEFCDAQVHSLPPLLEKSLLAMEGLILLDELTAAGQDGDAYGWREAVRVLEANWFEPLLRQLRKVGPHGLQLLDPINGKALKLQRTDAWKIWRPSHSFASTLA